MNALAKAGIELEENEPDIEEAPEEASANNRGFEAWVLCVEGDPPRLASYYNLTATL